MESLTWNKTDTDTVYAYMQEQGRPAYTDTVRSVTAENGVPYLSFQCWNRSLLLNMDFQHGKAVSAPVFTKA